MWRVYRVSVDSWRVEEAVPAAEACYDPVTVDIERRMAIPRILDLPETVMGGVMMEGHSLILRS